MELWELVARERIRETLAKYTWSGDGGRIDDLASAFHDDGALEVRGGQRAEGRAAIVDFLSGVGVAADGERPTIVRHLLTNTAFTSLAPDRAEVVSYFTTLTGIGVDHHGRYRDILEPSGDEWLIRHRFVSTDWRDPHSTMVAPALIAGSRP